jgi:DNA topoisomerase IB
VAHFQAVGRDARGRKQYRYHENWREVRDETEFEHMLCFGRALPLIRQGVDADLSRCGLPRDKVLAAGSADGALAGARRQSRIRQTEQQLWPDHAAQ